MNTTILVRRETPRWQKNVCLAIWILIPITFVLAFIAPSSHGLLGKLNQKLNQLSDLAWIFNALLFMFLTFSAFLLCLRDRAIRSGNERVLINDKGIQKTSNSPFLSIITAPFGGDSIPQWYANRKVIEKIELIYGGSIKSAILHIQYDKTRVRLKLTEWVYEHGKNIPKNTFRETDNSDKQVILAMLKLHPLLHELLERNYEIEFRHESWITIS